MAFNGSNVTSDLIELPKNWRYQPLSDLIDRQRGLSYGIVQPGKPTDQGVPIVRVNNIKKECIYTNDVLRIKSSIEEKYKRSRLRGGEVLLTLVGSLGESAIVPSELRGWNVARAVGVIPVRSDIGSLWVQLCLRSVQVQHYIRVWATTTVQATLNLRDLADLPIPVPPKEERETIAHILGTLEDKIELNRRMNETLERMAQALFKSWFVDFDPLRVLSGHMPEQAPFLVKDNLRRIGFPDRFQDSELGEIPEGWQVECLGKMVGLLGGYAFKSQDWCQTGVPVVKIGSIKPDFVDLKDVSYVSEKLADEAGRFRLQTADLVIGMTGHYVGEVGLIPTTNNPPLLNQRVGKFVLEKPGTESLGYIYCLTRRSNFKESVKGRSHGTAQANISAQGILSIPIVKPASSVLKIFNLSCRPLFDRLLLNHAEAETLTSIRDTLLPKLLSGEIRVDNFQELNL